MRFEIDARSGKTPSRIGPSVLRITYDVGSALPMPVLRLAYTTQFLIALIAFLCCGARWRPEPPGPDALVFQAGFRAGAAFAVVMVRGRRFTRARVERPDIEVVGDHGGIAGVLRPGQLLLPHVFGDRRGDDQQDSSLTRRLCCRPARSAGGLAPVGGPG